MADTDGAAAAAAYAFVATSDEEIPADTGNRADAVRTVIAAAAAVRAVIAAVGRGAIAAVIGAMSYTAATVTGRAADTTAIASITDASRRAGAGAAAAAIERRPAAEPAAAGRT